MSETSKKVLLACVPFVLMISFLLSGAGVANASVSYSMTYVANVAAGTSNNAIGSLEINLDRTTATVMSNDAVILSLPSSPAGYGLRVQTPSVYGATYSIRVDQVDQASVRLTVNLLTPSSDTVTILLPLVIDIPGGVNGDVQLTANAPPSSLFSSSSIPIAGFGIGIIRVAPDALDFQDVTVGSPSAAETVSISNAGFSDITIQNTTIAGANPDDFKLQDNLEGKIVSPGGSSVNAGVIFDPATTGAKQATLQIFSDDPYTPVYQVALTGNALPAANQPQSPPAPAGTPGIAVFKIGQTSFTVNGAVYNLDVAPYIKDSRAFLPLRYLANALGVQNSNILYDPASRKVTIIRGSTTVQLAIGSTTMLVNGAGLTMDAAPEINAGRTYLPVAWLVQALNTNITWDATTQTVTITF
jgi:phage baseplate assembly protein gpV